MRIGIVAWTAAHMVLPFGCLAAVYAALLGWQSSGYLLVASLFTYFVINQLTMGGMSRYAGELDDLTIAERRFLYIGTGCLLLVLAGACLAPTGWDIAAVLIVAGLLCHLTGHLGASFLRYRGVMNRPWPQVTPLAEDDDW